VKNLSLVVVVAVVFMVSGCTSFGGKGSLNLPIESFITQNATVKKVEDVHESVLFTGANNDPEVKRVGKITVETCKEKYTFSSELFILDKTSDTTQGSLDIIPSVGQKITVYLNDEGKVMSAYTKPNEYLMKKYSKK